MEYPDQTAFSKQSDLGLRFLYPDDRSENIIIFKMCSSVLFFPYTCPPKIKI